MYKAFVAFCEVNGKKPMTETRFGRIMKNKRRRNDTGARHVYADVKLHDVPMTEAESAATAAAGGAFGADPRGDPDIVF